MTNTEMKEFKEMFSKYCKDQINKGNCTGDTCEFCPIGVAYEEIEKFEKIGSSITVRIYNIAWDISDGNGDDEDDGEINLPDEVIHTFCNYNDIEDEDLLDEISDWLSDEYGFCHDGFEVEEIEVKKDE